MSNLMSAEYHAQADEQLSAICLAPRLMGVLPLKPVAGVFVIAWPQVVAVLYVVGVSLALDLTEDDFEGWCHADTVLKKIIHHVPVFATCLLLLTNTGMMIAKRNTLSEAAKELKDIQAVLGDVPKFRNTYMKLFAAYLIVEQISEFLFYKRVIFPILFHLNVFLLIEKFTVVNLFSSFLSIVRNCFEVIIREQCVQRIETQVRVHQRLCEAGRTLNSCFGPQLVVYMAITFLMNTVHVYTIITKYRESGVIDLGYITFSSCFVFSAFLVTRSCRLTSLAAKEFNENLYNLVLDDDTKSLITNDKVLSHFKISKKLEFTGMGFFVLDYNLLGAMLYTATTYIVILTQFS